MTREKSIEQTVNDYKQAQARLAAHRQSALGDVEYLNYILGEDWNGPFAEPHVIELFVEIKRIVDEYKLECHGRKA